MSTRASISYRSSGEEAHHVYYDFADGLVWAEFMGGVVALRPSVWRASIDDALALVEMDEELRREVREELEAWLAGPQGQAKLRGDAPSV